MELLGIDVGASGIKGALVDTEKGALTTDREKLFTPDSGLPEDMAETMKALASKFPRQNAIGVGFPAAIRHGICRTASNIDDSWIGINMPQFLESYLNVPVFCLNDADAAGEAEMQFGHGKKHNEQLVIMLTFGSGIGSAVFYKGKRIPNTELGHLLLHGDIAEKYASARTRKREDLDWDEWGKRLNEYLNHLEGLFFPDLFIIGGGLSRKFDRYESHISLDTPVMPASNENNAGIIGAAAYAAEKIRAKKSEW